MNDKYLIPMQVTVQLVYGAGPGVTIVDKPSWVKSVEVELVYPTTPQPANADGSINPEYEAYAKSRNKNYINNSKVEVNGYLNDQNAPGGSASKIQFGDVTGNGNDCSWMAIYNALYALGSPESPADIIYALEHSDLWAGLAGARLGASPWGGRGLY